jgi:hypothetical protein
MSETLLKLVVDQNSLDNSVRKAAETEFARLCGENPSSAAFFLMELASNDGLSLDLRQSCLIHLKQLVPKYWSMGFESFIGPPVEQSLKTAIRSNLLQLIVSPTAKLRNAVAYVIVQVAASDYPDEWPDLLNSLFQMSTDYQNELSVIGSLTVFTDLFDDLITDDQFWEGQVGKNVSNHILQLLTTTITYEAKTIATKLYLNIIQNLQSPEAFASEERKLFVLNHIQQSVPVFIELLNFTPADIHQFVYKSYLYKVLHTFVGAFDKKIDIGLKTTLLNISVNDFAFASQAYKSNVIDGNKTLAPSQAYKSNVIDGNKTLAPSQELEITPVLVNLINDTLQTINVTSHSAKIQSIDTFYHSLLISALYPQETLELYHDDINEYVTLISGLSVDATARDSILETLSEINENDAKDIFAASLQYLQGTHAYPFDEAHLYLLECILQNDVLIETNPLEMLNQISRFINFDANALVISRCFLMLPRFFEKFEDTLSVKSFGAKSFVDMINFAIQYKGENSDMVQFSALVSITLYKNILVIEECIDESKKHEIQDSIFKLVYTLTNESEEDGLSALLEATTAAINIDPIQASKSSIDNGVNVIDLIFKISFKDAANVQLTIESSESLQTLLEKISMDDYLVCCEKSLPFILNVINKSIEAGVTNVEYSPELYLSLELLSIIINSVPQHEISESIFGYTFPVLKKLLLLTTDNQILQSGGEVFNSILKRASKLFVNYTGPDGALGMNSLLEIVSKFLSPDLSDSAAMNSGLIILSLINQFQEYLGNDFLTQILEATVRRLVIAKETVTIENLVMVFCQLVLSSPTEMINFLGNSIHVRNEEGIEVSGLEAVLPIWFESFEVTRGYEKIKQNSQALGKIFMLGDSRVENLIVKGDIIPYQGDKIITRSMAKSMPDQYTQIPASLKILKLLVGELDFQNQQPNAADYLPVEGNEIEDDGDGWEDLEDIGVPNFEKLKSYVDSDNEEEDAGTDESLNQMLQTIFKECTLKNLGNFRKYYEMLSDNEKKVITECVAF